MRNEFIVPIGLMVVWVVSESHGSLGTDQSQKTQGFMTLSQPADFVTLSQSAENRGKSVTDNRFWLRLPHALRTIEHQPQRS